MATCLKKGANFVVYVTISLSSNWLTDIHKNVFIIMFFLSGRKLRLFVLQIASRTLQVLVYVVYFVLITEFPRKYILGNG